jgi:phosphatidylethanolamine-binding protein (PEBP) family uncharacterized protein
VLVIGLALPTSSVAGSLGVNFTWAGTSACSATPPAFTLSGVPKGTKYLNFELIDLDKPDYVHGGGQVAYTGSGRIPPGAFGGSYNGPCPPHGAHNYRWTVKALDVSGTKVLAEGLATGRFPPN